MNNHSEESQSPAATAFEIARRVAFSGQLLDRAVAAGVVGMPLTRLENIRRIGLEQMANLGLGEYEQSRLLKLFEAAVRAGSELPVDGEVSGLTPGLRELMLEAGTHVESLAEYSQMLNNAFTGISPTELGEWLPGGPQFDAVNRQRARHGNEIFRWEG